MCVKGKRAASSALKSRCWQRLPSHARLEAVFWGHTIGSRVPFLTVVGLRFLYVCWLIITGQSKLLEAFLSQHDFLLLQIQMENLSPVWDSPMAPSPVLNQRGSNWSKNKRVNICASSESYHFLYILFLQPHIISSQQTRSALKLFVLIFNDLGIDHR